MYSVLKSIQDKKIDFDNIAVEDYTLQWTFSYNWVDQIDWKNRSEKFFRSLLSLGYIGIDSRSNVVKNICIHCVH